MASRAHEFEPQHLQYLIDSIPSLIHTSRPDGYLDYFNQRWLQYVGLPMEAILGWKWTAAIHPEDVDAIVDKWRLSLASGEPFLHESRVRRADGEYRWMLHHKRAVRDQFGRIVKWYGSSIDIEDRKQAEEQLQRSTQELQRTTFYLAEAQRLGHIGGWVFDPRKGFDYWSRELFQIYGLDPATDSPPNSEQYLALIHPQDRESLASLLKRISVEVSGFDFTKRIVRPNGEVRYVRCVGSPPSADGMAKRIGVGIDVTDHELLTQELRRREAYLAEAQKLSHTGSFGWRPDSGEIVWSDETYRIFEYDRTSKPTLDMVAQRVHPEDRALAKHVIDSASRIGTGFEHEYRLLLSGGRIKHVHAIAHVVENTSGNREFVGAVTDISERKAAEAKIRDQEAEVRQILDLAPQYLAVLGPDGSPLYMNQGALEYFGIDIEQWRLSEFRVDRVHPDDREHFFSERQTRFREGLSHEFEARMRRHDGEFRWFLLRRSPLKDERGRVTRWYISATDIEDRKQAEERLRQENVALREEIDQTSMFEEIVGGSPALRTVLSRISKVASSESTVLITGETGTGKELVARAIHKRSQRSGRAFVSVNCAAIPRDLILSELFGHEKGAFTGAMQRRLGRFELAEGGTIFLDEVGELLPDTQVALLRVLQEREFERVGGGKSIHADVRVIAATNRNLKEAVANRNFRTDLFYRLNVFPIEMPSLRERKEDILILVEYFVQRYGSRAGKHIQSIDKRTLQLLQSYAWPGNIRELQNVIERSVILTSGDVLSVDELWLSKENSAPVLRIEALAPLQGKVEPHSEREIIEAALAETRGRVSGPAGAAAKLVIPQSTLEHRIKALKINKTEFKFR